MDQLTVVEFTTEHSASRSLRINKIHATNSLMLMLLFVTVFNRQCAFIIHLSFENGGG